jgi:protein tyrosine/serine phosphatase
VAGVAIVERDLERLIDFEGCFNFRDVGGYPVAGGRVRWRRLFRADGLSRLTAPDLARAQEFAVATVIDLRTDEEVADRGKVAESVATSYHHLPMLDALPDRADLIARATPNDWATRYAEMLIEGEDALAEILAILTDPTSYPAVVHCTAGKDRTGIVIAAVLGVLGADDDTLAADYALSRHGMERMLAWLRAEYPERATELAEIAPSAFASHADAMYRFCAHVRREFGSFNGWASTIGMASAVPHIRAALVV